MWVCECGIVISNQCRCEKKIDSARIYVMQKVIKTENLIDLIAAVTKNQTKFFGPVDDSGNIILSELSAKSKVSLDYSMLKLPAKRHFFPWSEEIYSPPYQP